MGRITNYLNVVLFLNIWAVYESAARCPIDVAIQNGHYHVAAEGYILFFECNEGFYLYGLTSTVCFGTVWSNPPPSCIPNTCQKVESSGAFHVEAKHEGSKLSFLCAAGFELVGNDSIHCNGSHWSAPIPKCVKTTRNLSCDFEGKDLCGWTHDPEGDFDWTWETGTTPTQGTGPSYDHTLGPNGQGHYMFIETSAPNKYGDQAILKSPFFMADDSGQCFNFWYHSFGSGSLSKLEVFVWKEGDTKEDLTPRFTLDYVTGREWQNKIFNIPLLNETFKIMFVGTRLRGHKHDIAIDDVSLGPCPENGTSSTVSFITTTILATTVNPPATVAEITAKQTSSTTRENTNITTIVSTQISKSKSSTPVAESTLQKDISSQESTPSVLNFEATTTKNVQKLIGDRKIDMTVGYVMAGVVTIVALVVIVAIVYYLHQRRRKARYSTEDMASLYNPAYEADTNNQGQ